MDIAEKIRNALRTFLKIEPPAQTRITLQPPLNYYANAAKNRIWYRGDSAEITQLYAQIDAPPTMFWKASSTRGMEIRKIHTGLPKLIVNTLTDIIVNDYSGAELTEGALQEIWDKTYDSNGGDKLIKRLVRNMLVVGDGAYKVYFDAQTDKEYPIVRFVQGEYVDFERRGGRIHEVVFNTVYEHNRRKFTLREVYGYGYIQYHLYAENGSEVPLQSIPQTEWIDTAGVTFDKNIMLAVPCIYNDSERFEGRGEGVFDGKIDSFDALDESWSQWLDALRAGRAKQYIPECLIPKNPQTGTNMQPNPFDNRYIAVGSDMSEQAQNRIVTEQPGIPYDSYLNTYITALDLCLQGIISPSTLGIDVKKMDNAEAQREKEKTTLYTRGSLVQIVDAAFSALVRAVVCGYQMWHNQPLKIPECSVNFGEYANPSFEAVVETVTKAKQGGIMSLEACIEEMYGDSKNPEWKEAEVARLKAEQGIDGFSEPDISLETGVV